MKQPMILFAVFFLVTILSGCVLETAEEPTEKELSILADHLTKEDSLIIEEFGKKNNVKIRFQHLRAELIAQRIQNNQYNANIDVLLINNDSLRKALFERGLLKPLANKTHFNALNRQFNNAHHCWITVCYNPLVLAQPSDSMKSCSNVDFTKWHKGIDSLKPIIKINQNKTEYFEKLAQSSQFSWLSKPVVGRLSNERIYALSELVSKENNRDSTFSIQAHRCKTFLIDKKRFICTEHTASIYRYGRNTALANKFIDYYLIKGYLVASGRNQIPASKKTQTNYLIRSLNIQ